jgi:uncharacterized membrane protein
MRDNARCALNRTLPMTHPVPAVIYVHFLAAAGALVLGMVQLLRRKGTASHRAAGWTWVALMLAVAISSLWIPAFLQFSWIHIFTAITLIALPVALWRIRRGDVAGHARTMKGLYIGGILTAGAFTLVPGRLLGNLLWKSCWAC